MPPMPFDGPSSFHSRQDSSDLNSPGRPFNRPDDVLAQSELLEGLCNTIVADAEIETAEIMEKENFRLMIEQVARSTITDHERNQNGFGDFPPESVQLKCFGSLASGFATKASDMDLGLLSPLSHTQPDAPGSLIPRLIEKAFLDIGLGARLLTQTRVPIIKVCQSPPEELRLALLEERTKWEKGVTEDGDEDAAHESPELRPVEDPQAPAEIQKQEETLAPEQKLKGFKQNETSSLPAYFGSAKRLLRKVGGRDITHSNASEFKVEDVTLLNQVSLAFVDGLADSKLRDRLLGYRSLNRYDLTSHANNRRTLLGVFTQVEGEHMAMLWESRPFPEKDRGREATADKTIRSWRAVQDRPHYGQDPLGYQKELQIAADQLRKISTIQVLLLSQAHNESAANYCARALRLLHELGGHDSRPRLDAILPTLIEHYIGGISNQTIRDQVRDFHQAHGVTNLRAIGRRHKSLQLAHDYEACLAKGMYDDETAAKVRRYVELLQAPIEKSAGYSTGMIPLPSDSASLLSEIRLLGDPSSASPNQPRDRYSSALEFPKSGVGVQCDINFSAHLAVQNTLLLRCYSHCDPRVRPLVLFVKHWAKVRRINSPYRGTLGSYGYALMMLHYLVNVAQPFVCPNLQQLARPPGPDLTPQQIEETVRVKGQNIQFWRDEAEITRLARDNVLTQNQEPIGQLLRGFFEYYAKGGQPMAGLPCRSFDWGRDVLSLRTHGGLLTKQAKGWTGAKTVVEVQSAAAAPPPAPPLADSTTTDPTPTNPQPSQPGQPQPPQAPQNPPAAAAEVVKEVRYRYLFAIEDPFELDHNVARTVTHTGIVNIRDEFRRAWRIIKNAGRGGQQQQQGHGNAGGGGGGGGAAGGQSQGPGQGQGQGNWKQEDLLEDVGRAEEEREREGFVKLWAELHGVGAGLPEEGGGEAGGGE
jgi:DNA polymerase sigma